MSYFSEIITALGATTYHQKAKSESWEFAEAAFETPAGEVIGNYLYLNSKSAWQDASSTNLSTWTGLSGSGGYQVVTAPSSPMSSDLERTARVFRANKAQSIKDLLLASFGRQLATTTPATETHDHFIDPDLELPNGQTVTNASLHLASWLTRTTGEQQHDRSIAVVVADGGVGKTTLSRVLTSKVYSQHKNIFPVLVESGTWRNIANSNIQLRDIIERSIANRYTGAIRLTNNEDVLRALFRSGVLLLIFDGFDELCVHPHSTLTPKQILEELSDLAKSEEDGFESRIIITTRESYWQSISTEIDPNLLEIFKIRGFDNEKKKNYFQKRLQSPSAIDLALRIAKQIGGALYKNSPTEGDTTDRPSGVPFILDLIARYIEDNQDIESINPYEADPLAHLLEGLCRRENVRQRLEIDPYKQLELFEELFREYDDKIQISDLELFAEVFCNVRDKETVSRLANHVFLAHAGPGLLTARYEVLRVYFVARFLSNGLTRSGNGNGSSAESRHKIASILASQSGGQTQIIDALVDQLKRHPNNRLVDAIKQASSIIAEQINPKERLAAATALTHIVSALCNEQKTKADRTLEFARLLDIATQSTQLHFDNLAFSGTITGFDLSNVMFRNCVFSNIIFSKCRFTEASIFHGSEFIGTLEFQSCESPGDTVLQGDCILSKEAEFSFSKIHNSTARKEVKRSLAEEAATRALKRFRTEFGFISSQARRMGNGFQPGNPYNEKVWVALFSFGIIEKHKIAGVTEGGLNIVENKEIRREVSDFLDNGVLGGTLRNAIYSLTE